MNPYFRTKQDFSGKCDLYNIWGTSTFTPKECNFLSDFSNAWHKISKLISLYLLRWFENKSDKRRTHNYHPPKSCMWLYIRCKYIHSSKIHFCNAFVLVCSTMYVIFTMICCILLINVLLQNYNRSVVNFTMISPRWSQQLNPGPQWTYYCWTQELWEARGCPSTIQ